MLRPVLLLPAILLAAPLAAQEAPAISFDKAHHDFGKISPDKKVSHKFKVTNNGKGILSITNLNASCGCTSTVVGKWSLNPGESSEVEATFDPKGQRGVVRKSVTVTSNDPKNPAFTLTFEADVVQEVMAKPGGVFFPEVPRATPRKSSLRLESGNGQPVKVTDISAPGAPYLSWAQRQEGNDAILDITFDGRKVPEGQLRGADWLTVRTTSQQVPVLSVSVQWELKPVIASTPERIAWVDAAGKEQSATLKLRHADGKPFRITGTAPTSPLLKVTGLDSASAPEHAVTVTFAATAKAGTYTENVVFLTDDPDMPKVAVRVAAILR
ncbi:MAG: DUF1573 domain-containing protein [Holophagaceae bacterium]